MRQFKVLNVRTHIGGLHGMTSYDSEKHGVEMTLEPAGVLIRSTKEEAKFSIQRDGKAQKIAVILPWANVTEVIVEDAPVEEEKRGPGRPPKQA